MYKNKLCSFVDVFSRRDLSIIQLPYCADYKTLFKQMRHKTEHAGNCQNQTFCHNFGKYDLKDLKFDSYVQNVITNYTSSRKSEKHTFLGKYDKKLTI